MAVVEPGPADETITQSVDEVVAGQGDDHVRPGRPVEISPHHLTAQVLASSRATSEAG